MTLLNLNNVAYQVNQNTLVKDISLSINTNDMISLIGPNGAGKSTLVKLMIGLLSPTSGSIERHKNLTLGYVPQKFSVPSILPLRTIDLLNQSLKNRLTTKQRDFVINTLSIKTLLDKQLISLSGGETQRVLLARALLDRPNLLILDEPMQGLDPDSETLLYQFIESLPDFLRCAILIVSHDLHWVMQGSKHVVCLNKHICCQGQPTYIQGLEAFKELFGHSFQQPYIHQQHSCDHNNHNNHL